MAKKPDPFNNPFSAVKLAPKAEGKKAAPPPPPRLSAKKQRTADEEDAALFLQAMGDAAKIPEKATRVSPVVPRPADQVPLATEDAESMAQLAELVTGEGDFEVSVDGSFVEGAVKGFDPGVLRKLRAGEFSYQATVDLHGMTREQARPELERFVQQARVAGHRCVLVVTGQGLHSEDQVPVIKEHTQEWLTRGRPAKQVLAFCSALPRHGGAGALYVLLRR